MKPRTVFSAAGLVLLVLLVIGYLLAPTVESFQPEGEALHGTQPIHFQFDRAVDPDSVSSRLVIRPAQEGTLSWNEAGDRYTFHPQQPWPSGSQVSVEIQPGARSRLHLPLLRPALHKFQVSPYLLAYLWPADEDSDLYLLNPENGESRQLIAHPNDIQDYVVHPDGLTLYFSAISAEGEGRIYAFDRLQGTYTSLINCRDAACQQLEISPDGNHLLFEQLPPGPAHPPGIRLYSFADGQSSLVGDADHHLENPRWALPGWFSVYDRTAQAFLLFNHQTGERLSQPNQTGGSGTWSPQGPSFVMTEIYNIADTLATRHMLRYHLGEDSLVDLTGSNTLEDANPAYSPSGDYLAFGRKSLDPDLWTPGRQLWIREAGQGEGYPLTDEVDYNHTAFTWHPSELELVYVRYNQAELAEPPEIWITARDGRERYRLLINGHSPQWIP